MPKLIDLTNTVAPCDISATKEFLNRKLPSLSNQGESLVRHWVFLDICPDSPQLENLEAALNNENKRLIIPQLVREVLEIWEWEERMTYRALMGYVLSGREDSRPLRVLKTLRNRLLGYKDLQQVAIAYLYVIYQYAGYQVQFNND